MGGNLSFLRFWRTFGDELLCPFVAVQHKLFLALIHHAQAQEVEAGSAVHLAFDELEPMDLAFDVTLGPGQFESCAHGVDVSFHARGEACQGGVSCSFQPSLQRIQAAFAKDAEEARGKLCDLADLG